MEPVNAVQGRLVPMVIFVITVPVDVASIPTEPGSNKQEPAPGLNLVLMECAIYKFREDFGLRP